MAIVRCPAAEAGTVSARRDHANAADPHHGEKTYKGSGKLNGKVALITGADSGIGRAVAIAYAREGADILISYLSEDDDANETARLVEVAGRKVIVVPGDIKSEAHCNALVERAVADLGGIDILVNNAAFQRTYAIAPPKNGMRRFEPISTRPFICRRLQSPI